MATTQAGLIDPSTLALVGCGGRGEPVMKNCLLDPAVEVVGLCDVWDERIGERRQVVPVAVATTVPFRGIR